MTERPLDANHERIWLSPRCDDERTWCKDNVFDTCSDCGQRAVEYIRADLAATHPSTGGEGGVRVKELPWSLPNLRGDGSNYAETQVGHYHVWTHHEANSKWFWRLDNAQVAPSSGEARTADEAKAAAQADYERRILTAIEPVAASPGVPDGEWVYLVYDWAWTDDTGQEHYARTPERAERLKTEGRKLTPVYTRERRSDFAPTSPAPSPAGGDGWIEWNGGDCPVGSDTEVEFKRRSGEEVAGIVNAAAFNWGRYDKPMLSDIIAYRVLSSKQRSEKE